MAERCSSPTLPAPGAPGFSWPALALGSALRGQGSGPQSFCCKVGPRSPPGPHELPGRGGHPPPPAAARWHSCPAPLPVCFPRRTSPARERPSLSSRAGPVRPARSAGQRTDTYLGGRHSSPRVQAAAGRSQRLARTAGPGSSLPVPVAAGAVIQPGSVRAWPASPRPPAGAGHAGAASPLAGPGQDRRGARDPDGLCPAAGVGRGRGRWTGAGT